ncbi:MAG: PAS domain S-box protein [Desulfobacterales bacterium]|nr:PAS domain S-box protein [Desulfobacterales bacterium]
MIFADDQGKAHGMFADVLQWIAHREGWQLNYTRSSFHECLVRLEKNDIDLTCAIAYSKNRAETMRFGRESLLTNWGQVYTTKDSEIRDLTDLSGLSVALLRQDIYNSAFRELLRKFNISCRFVETEDYHGVLDLVSNGTAGAGVVSRLFGHRHADDYGVEKSGVVFNPIRIQYAFAPDTDPGVIRRIDHHISALKEDKSSIYYRSLDRWLDQETAASRWPAWFLAGTAGSIGVIGLLVLGNYLLRNKIRSKTRALKTQLAHRNQAEANLRATLHSIGDAVIATDDAGVITLMNPVAETLTGWPADQAIGMPLAQIFRTVDNTTGLTEKDPARSVLDSGESTTRTGETTLISKTGNAYKITDGASPIKTNSGALTGVVLVFRDMTDTAKMQADIRKNEAYLRSVFRASPIGIGVVTHRKFTKLNQKVLDMTGYTRAELLEKDTRILYPNDAEYTYVGTEKYRQIEQEGAGTVETIWQKKDGGQIHVLLSSTPLSRSDLSKGITFSALDITTRKQAELMLQKSENQYRTLFEKTNDAIFLISAGTGVYLDANPAAQDLTGQSLSDLKQKTITDHTTPNSMSLPLDLTPGLQKYQGEFTFNRPDNSQRIARLNTVPFTEDVLIGFAKDVTQDLQMEKQLRQAQKMESIGTLAGGIAHDFNNILFPIMGFAEMLLNDIPEDSPLRHGLDQIYASAMRAKELVAQILAFSRQSQAAPMPVKLAPVIKEALKLLRATIPATIEISQEIERDCGMVTADPTQIHQILINLATNAFHAMEATGGTLTVILKNVSLSMGEERDLLPGEYVKLSVIDTGPGIPEDIQENIFDPFFTTKEKGRGTGMGLAVVHGIVMGIGGRLKVDSAPEKGAAFHLYLPQAPADGTAWETKVESPIINGTETVLLVDDEPQIISMETQLLKRMGYKVIPFTNSLKALEAFRAAPERFDLVISDIAMPGMAGDRLAKEMIKISPQIPILLCTGFSETMNEEKAESIGVKGFLLKPMIPKALSAKIRRVMGESLKGETNTETPKD